MYSIKSLAIIIIVLTLNVFALDTLNIQLAPKNDVYVTYFPTQFDANALFNSAGWLIGAGNVTGTIKEFHYNESFLETDLRNIPDSVEIVKAQLFIYVSKVVMISNHDNELAFLEHYRSTGFTGNCLSDLQNFAGPTPVTEYVYTFYSSTQIGWIGIDVTSKISADVRNNCDWAAFGIKPAPHGDPIELLGEAKGVVTASANNSSNQPYLRVVMRKKTALPDVPSLVYPSKNSSDIPVNTKLVWNQVSKAQSFYLQVAKDISFSSIILKDSTISDTTCNVSSLLSNATYYWRVCAENDGGKSAWSEVWSFTTIPSVSDAPTLVSPLDQATDQPLELQLSWNVVTGASSYRIQLSKTADFSTTVLDDSTLIGNSKTIGPLANGTAYYWRVNAKNAGGTSPWSEIRSFTTIPSAADAPALTSPADKTTDQPLSLQFSWSSVTGAKTYRIQLSTFADLSSPVLDDSMLTVNSKTIGSLANNTTYYWRVNAKNAGGTSPWSEIRSFTTIPSTADAPALASPADKTTDQPLSLQFSWSSVTGAKTYRIQLSTAADLSSPVLDDSILTVNSKTIGSLANNTTYYWRVNAKNAGGTSPWSEIRSFSTLPALPGVVTLLSPEDDSIIATDSIRLIWGKPSGIADKYLVEIFSNAELTTVFFADSAVTDTTIICGALQNRKSYWWRVKAHNSAGWGNMGPARKFTVEMHATALLPGRVITDFSGISSANGSFRYGLPSNSRVLIRTYTLQGKQVKTYINGYQKAGFYQVNMESSNLANGQYILFFKAGNFNMKRMVSIYN